MKTKLTEKAIHCLTQGVSGKPVTPGKDRILGEGNGVTNELLHSLVNRGLMRWMRWLNIDGVSRPVCYEGATVTQGGLAALASVPQSSRLSAANN